MRKESKCCKPIPTGQLCLSKRSEFERPFHGGCNRQCKCLNNNGIYMCDYPSNDTWWYGVIVAVCTASISVILLNYRQKVNRTMVMPRRRVFSNFLMALCNFCLLYAFAISPLSLIAPFCTVGNVFHILCGITMKIAIFQPISDVLYTIVMLIGCYLLCLYSAKFDQAYDSCEIFYLFHFSTSWSFLLGCTCLFLLLFFVLKTIEANLILSPSRYVAGLSLDQYTIPTQKPLLRPFDALFRHQFLRFSSKNAFWALLLAVSYGYIVSFFAMIGVLSAKLLFFLLMSQERILETVDVYLTKASFLTLTAITGFVFQYRWTVKACAARKNKLNFLFK